MAVSDLTNTTWYFNNYVDTSEYVDANLTFVSNGNTYTHFLVDDDIGKIGYKLNNSFVWVTDANGEWIDQSYRTIEITGGTDVTNDAFITWLEAWAEQQGGGSTAKTQVGTSTIAKKMFGTTPIAKEVVNGVTVYEATPTPSGYTVHIQWTGNSSYAPYGSTAYYNKNSDGNVNLVYEEIGGQGTTITEVQTLSVLCPVGPDGCRIMIDSTAFKGWYQAGDIYDSDNEWEDILLDVTQYLQDDCYITLYSRE